MIEGTKLQKAVLELLADAGCRDSYYLRGSLLTRLWVGAERRCAQDIDLLATYSHDPERTMSELTAALLESPMGGEIFDPEPRFQRTWLDSDFPGLKMTLTALDSVASDSGEVVRIDIGYDDPVVAEHPEIRLGRGRRLRAVAPEVMFGWKLHGLYESDGWWRAKDLADLWLMQAHLSMSSEMLRRAISEAFSSRQTPLWKLHRLLAREMGQSSGSRRGWRALLRDGAVREVPREVSTVVEDLATFLRPITAAMELGKRPVWAVDPRQEECEAVLAACDDFRRYAWQDSAATYVYERIRRETFPQPFSAPTTGECRQRLVRWECRGLTLDGASVLARPFPRLLPDRELTEHLAEGASVTLKLDGSLIFPTRLAAGSTDWCWRTRRGISSISEDASVFTEQAFAEQNPADYRGLVDTCLAAGQTPLFEWCSRKRLLILDQSADRLVLTALRDNASGLLHPQAEVAELGRRFGIETVSCLGIIGVDFSLAELRSCIAAWREREGVVVLTAQNRLYKMKSSHYRLLHGAIEGPAYDMSRWRLILEGDEDALLAAASRRGIDLHPYVARAHTLLARVAEGIQNWCERYEGDRGAFARALPLAGLAKHWTFCALDGADLEPMIRKDLVRALERRGNWHFLMKQLQELVGDEGS